MMGIVSGRPTRGSDGYGSYSWPRLERIATLRTIIIKDFIKVVTASSTPFGTDLTH